MDKTTSLLCIYLSGEPLQQVLGREPEYKMRAQRMRSLDELMWLKQRSIAVHNMKLNVACLVAWKLLNWRSLKDFVGQPEILLRHSDKRFLWKHHEDWWKWSWIDIISSIPYCSHSTPQGRILQWEALHRTGIKWSLFSLINEHVQSLLLAPRCRLHFWLIQHSYMAMKEPNVTDQRTIGFQASMRFEKLWVDKNIADKIGLPTFEQWLRISSDQSGNVEDDRIQ